MAGASSGTNPASAVAVPTCVRLVLACALGAFAAGWPATAAAQVTVAVDVAANRRPIDPNIYGVAHAGTAELTDLNVPLNRYGGNNTTRTNWQQNADNRGADCTSRASARPAPRPAKSATRSSPTPAPPARRR